MHQQAYQQLGVQTLLKLLPAYPNAEELTELTSLMISVASSKGVNTKFLLENKADDLLIKFIKVKKKEKQDKKKRKKIKINKLY